MMMKNTLFCFILTWNILNIVNAQNNGVKVEDVPKIQLTPHPIHTGAPSPSLTAIEGLSGNAELFGIKQSDRKAILDRHNEYRSKVTPTASDMIELRWDNNLAASASDWAAKCNSTLTQSGKTFAKVSQFDQLINAVDTWYKDNYKSIVWASTGMVGCATSPCSDGTLSMVCNYFPLPNLNGEQQPYLMGNSCTKCGSVFGSWCHNKLCTHKKDSSVIGDIYECKMYCLNCGILDPNECNCECKDGFDQPNCETGCKDESSDCKNPSTCTSDWRIRNVLCRKSCKLCSEVGEKTKPDSMCCHRKLCQAREALDKKCHCVPIDKAINEGILKTETIIGNKLKGFSQYFYPDIDYDCAKVSSAQTVSVSILLVLLAEITHFYY